MKAKLSIFLFFVLIFTGISSIIASPRLYGQEVSSVWKISKNDNTVFLGGSIHILREEDFPLPEAFDRAFAASSMLVLEANIDELSSPDALQYLMERMVIPDNKTLQSVLDSETYELLMAKCLEAGIPAENVSRLKPSMVMSVLTVLEFQKWGFVQEGVDSYYFEKAKAAKTPIDFLETVQEQIDMVVTMGDGYENDYVRYSLHDWDASFKEFLPMLSDWKKGEGAYTESELAVVKNEWPIIYNSLLLDRNTAWVEKIEAYLTTAPVEFVVVGMAHLHGPDGLLRLLELSGCIVEQFK